MMTNRNMKKCSPCLAIRQIQIKTTQRPCITSVRMAVMKTVNRAGSGDHGAKGPLHTAWCGGKLVPPICKLVYTFLKKIKIPLSHDQIFRDQGMYPKDSKPINRRDSGICGCHGPIHRVKLQNQPRCYSQTTEDRNHTLPSRIFLERRMKL